MELSIHTAAEECPDQVALFHKEGVLTYGELAGLVSRACAALRKRDVVSAKRVGICASNRWQTVVMLHALIELGIPFVLCHPRWTQSELEFVKSDSGWDTFIDDELCNFCVSYKTSEVIGKTSVSGEHPLAVLYSSGTSGTPKGVVLPRRSFIASARGSANYLHWHLKDRWLVCLPLAHIGGLSIVTRCSLARRSLLLLSSFSVGDVLNAIDLHHATLLSLVPTMLSKLLDEDRQGVLTRLRAVICGGAKVPFPLLQKAVSAGVNVVCTYGLTEACSQVTVQKWSPVPSAQDDSGEPIPGLEIAIRNDAGANVERGVVGQIWIRGQCMMSGYLHGLQLAGAWFDTGDFGRMLESGALQIVARRTDLIITGGENVYPTEVEHVLCALSGVKETLVFGVPDPVWGEVVAASVVLSEEPDFLSWESVLKRKLASFKRPRLWAIVASLPLLQNGKMDRERAKQEARPLLRPLDKLPEG